MITPEEIKEALVDNGDGSGKGVLSIWPFVHEIQRGDIVVANKGLSQVVSIGVIKSRYLQPEHHRNPNNDRDWHTHCRLVDWRITEPVDLRQRLFNQPTVQQLSSTQCSVIRQASLRWHPEWSPLLDELLPVRLSEDDAGKDLTPYQALQGDLRQTVERQIKERRGQPRFWEAMRVRFADHCVITGCTIVDVLEGAHINPYRGTRDNHIENGLLLRADIHTLFDLNLIGINPATVTVELHPKLDAHKEYARLAGNALPFSKDQCHSIKALKARYKQFCEALQQS
jgi:hypothetical protein